MVGSGIPDPPQLKFTFFPLTAHTLEGMDTILGAFISTNNGSLALMVAIPVNGEEAIHVYVPRCIWINFALDT